MNKQRFYDLPSILVLFEFPSAFFKKVGGKNEQTKVYDHVVTSTHVVKKIQPQ